MAFHLGCTLESPERTLKKFLVAPFGDSDLTDVD